MDKIKHATLVAHVDTKYVDEAEVLAVPAPAFTKSWRPFAHGDIIKAVGTACEEKGLKVIDRKYSLSEDQKKLFGVWEIGNGTNSELNFAMGVRNSIDKTRAVGLCAGERVFVCDNLVFSADFILFRKHTGDLSYEELVFIAKGALSQVLPQFEALKAWHEALKATELNEKQAAILLVAAMRRDIVPPSKFAEFTDLYFDKETKYSPTLHGWHGAATEIMRGNGLDRIHYKNSRLNNFINNEVPLLLEHVPAGGKKLVFAEVEKKAEDKNEEGQEEKKAAKNAMRKEGWFKFRDHRRAEKREERLAAKKEQAPAKAEAAPKVVEKDTSRLKKKGRPIVDKIKVAKSKKKATKAVVKKEIAVAKKNGTIPDFMKIKAKPKNLMEDTD